MNIPIDKQSAERRIFERIVVDKTQAGARYEILVVAFEDKTLDSVILKQRHLTGFSEDIELHQNLPADILERLANTTYIPGVDPQLESLKHGNSLVLHFDGLIVRLFELAIQSCFKVWRSVTEQLFV